MQFLTFAKRMVRSTLALFGFELVRIHSVETSEINPYRDVEGTIALARSKGVTVCELVEEAWGQAGLTQYVMDEIRDAGVFEFENPSIVEVGTGTGRYLEKTLQLCEPAVYESYEVIQGWSDWLEQEYRVTSRVADGWSLGSTKEASVDILQAHGVFVARHFMISYSYFREIWRVVRPGGYAVFDIISEECLGEDVITRWVDDKHTYPKFLSKSFVIERFSQQGFVLVHCFTKQYDIGLSEYLVFKREAVPSER